MSAVEVRLARPEDHERLPKALPKDEPKKDDKKGDAKKADDKGDDKKASKGDDKDAKGDGNDDAAQDTDPQHAKRIHLPPVKVGRDYGTEVEIVEGLQAGATIVANPGDFVAEDALVMPQKRKADEEKEKPGGSGAPQGNQSPSMVAPTKGRK